MIICCGEALIDMIPTSIGEGEIAYRPCTGGSIFNTAIALGRLNAPVGMITGLSTDLFGDMLASDLEESSVDISRCIRVDRPTTLAFVNLVNGQARYSFYDENSAGRMLNASDFPALPGSLRAAFFGGISLISEPCGTAYENLLNRLSPDHVTMVDVNVRPGFIKNETAYRARVHRMTSRADIVKLSDEDIRWLDKENAIDQAAQRILESGAKLVTITLGSRGARAYHRGGMVEVPAREASVVDTVGAGDTFNAGLLASLDDDGALDKSALEFPTDEVLRRALTLGVTAAAVTVSRAGANPPWRNELQ